MARIAVKQNGKRKADSPAQPDTKDAGTSPSEDPTFPKMRLVEQEQTIKISEKMEFVSTKENGIVTTTVEPVHKRFRLAGFDWEVDLKMNKRGELSSHIRIGQKLYNKQWKIDTCRSFLFSYENGNSYTTDPRKVVFDAKTRDVWGQVAREGWCPFLKNPDDNQEVRTEVNMELQFTLTQIVGFRCRKSFSYDFTERSQQSNLVFKFGDQKVYLDCDFLSYHSEYFEATQARLKTMVIDDDGLPSREILDVKREEFMELLQVIYPGKKEITDDNVLFVLVLADRFMFEGVLKGCEKFLMSKNSNTDIFLKLHWSSLYHMIDLQEWCFAQLKTRGAIDKVKKADVYSELSCCVKSSLLEKMLDI